MDVAEYARLRRDTKRENEVADWLRGIKESERVKFLKELAELNAFAATILIRKSQLEPGSLAVFLRYGLKVGDASSVNWWIQATHAGLGPKKLLAELRSQIRTNPEGVDKALYFIPQYFVDDEKYQSSARSFRSEFRKIHPGYVRPEQGHLS